jgi:uncharacterized protein YhaN
MRFLSLDLLAYGPFTQYSIDLSHPTAGLHVLYGPNEAGKSTTLRAIVGLLYGIERFTPDAHLHENTDLRIGATLARATGERISIVRRKGNKNTLLDADGKPLDEDILQNALGRVAEPLFRSMFGLDHEGLRAAGKELAQGAGAGESLFSAGVGATGLHDLLKSLREEANKLFSLRGKGHAELGKYAEHLQRVKELALKPSDWETKKEALAAARVAHEAIRSKVLQFSQDVSRLQRLTSTLPLLADRQRLLTDQQGLGDVVLLPASAAQEREAAQKTLRTATEQLGELETRLAAHEKELAGIHVPEDLLQAEAELQELTERLGSYKKAQYDAETLRGSLRSLEDRMQSALQDLGKPTLPLSEVQSLQRLPSERTQLLEWMAQGPKLEDRLAKLSDDRVERAVIAQAKTGQLADLPPAIETIAVSDVLVKLQADGDLDKAIRVAQKGVDDAEAEADLARRALLWWEGHREDAARLPVPPDESIRQFEKRLSAIEQRQGSVQEKRTRLVDEQRQLGTDLDVLERAGAVPTEVDLTEGRRRRDAAWQQIRGAWQEGVAFIPSAANDYASRVESADELSDRLRREADRVARKATLEATRAARERDLLILERETEEVAAERAAWEAQWRALWTETLISPRSPEEMRAWRQRWVQLGEAARKLRAAQSQVAVLRETQDAHYQSLSVALESCGASAAVAGESYAALVARSRTFVRAAEQRAQALEQARKEAYEAREALAKLEPRVAAATAELAEWRRQWSTAMTALDLAPETTPKQLSEILTLLDNLLVLHRDSIDKSNRIQGIEKDAERFALRVAKLAPLVGGAWPNEEVHETAARLLSRHREGSEAKARRDGLRIKVEQLREQLQKEQRNRVAAEETLAQLLKIAGCQSVEELPEKEARSHKAHEIRAALHTLEQRLLGVGSGLSLDALQAEAEGQFADTVHAMLRERKDEQQRLEAERSEIEQRLGRLMGEVEGMSGGDAAAAAAGEAQAALARVRADVERSLRLRLAAALLERTIEQYRTQNEGPVIERASVLFRRLTLEQYERVRTTFNEHDEAVLCCVRDGREIDITKALSDGTRDQLYLALRLASLERYIARNEAMPFIVDDIFIHFDDERAREGLRILGELSQRTQVLFFTHHQRLVELAREALPEGTWREHRLMPTSVPKTAAA